MKHTKNLTKIGIYSKIQNTSVIFLNHSRVIVHTIAKWCKKMHSGIFNVSSLLLLVSPKFFGTTASARRSLKMKKFTKTAGVSNGRFAAIIGVLATALIITACGGGGGGSATDPVITLPPIVVTPPVVVVPSIFAAPVTLDMNNKTAVDINMTTVISVEFTPVNFTNPIAVNFTATSTGATFNCGGVKVSNGVLSDFTVAPVTGSVKWTATSNFAVNGLPYATNCAFSLPLTIVSGAVSSNPVTVSFSFTTKAMSAFVWPNDVKTIVEVGIVNGVANQALAIKTWIKAIGLPIGANPRDPAWDLELANGNIQILKTGETANDLQGIKQTLWRAVYEQPTGGYCFAPVYSNTGMIQSRMSCIGDKLAYVIGVSDVVNPANSGIIYRGTGTVNGTNCWRNTVALGDRSVTCPF